jgi:hypothetical protein
MIVVGHMFSAIAGGLVGVASSATVGHPFLTCVACYSLGGLLGVIAFSVWTHARSDGDPVPDEHH